MFTSCTTSFNIQKFYVLPHNVFVCFVLVSEQTAIISLYGINWLVFVSETGVLTARYELSFEIKEITFIIECLILVGYPYKIGFEVLSVVKICIFFVRVLTLRSTCMPTFSVFLL
jgi:hypothetical protein